MLRLVRTAAIGAAIMASATVAPSTTHAADVDDVPLKPARSEFAIREFSTVFNDILLVPHPSAALPTGGRPRRKVYGRVVDHAGQPIAAAKVGLAPSFDSYGEYYYENFDKTDELGRFLLEAHDTRRQILVVRDAGNVKVPLAETDEFVRVVWPAPSRVRVTIDRELAAPGSKVYLNRQQAVLDVEGTATFDDVMPGERRVIAWMNFLGEGDHRVYASREFGRLTIAGGENRDVAYDGAGRIPVRGEAPGGWCATIFREQTRASETTGGVDGGVVGDDGKFLLHVPGPGDYCLTVHARPLKMIDAFDPNQTIHINGIMDRRRFVVDESTTSVDLGPEETLSPAARFVHGTLDSEGSPNVTYSHADVEVAQLVRHKDRDGVAAELLRIVRDPHSPSNWHYVTFQALGDMTDTPAVAAGLLDLLDNPPADDDLTAIIEAVAAIKQDLPQVAERLAPFAGHRLPGVRGRALSSLSRLADKHPELKPQLTAALIAVLADDYPRNRADAAAAVGWLKIDEGAAGLLPLLADPNYKIRLAAAKSLWQITGDPHALLSAGAEILTAGHDDYEMMKDAAYAIREVPRLPPETLAALKLLAAFKKEPPFKSGTDLMRRQLASIANQILIAHAIADEE